MLLLGCRHVLLDDLEEYYRLPDTLVDGAAALFDRFAEQGLNIVIQDDGVMRPATTDELGIAT